MSIYDIPFATLAGEPATLAPYRGKVMVLVNVASKCGLTPQYQALEALYQSKRGQGLVVVGFPANDFGAQEPGSSEEIAEFCTANFGVRFPMGQKISVKGPDQHPLYAFLTAEQPVAIDGHAGAFSAKLEAYGQRRTSPEDVLWNFEKFLVGRNGKVVARFNPDVRPDDAMMVSAIEQELYKD